MRARGRVRMRTAVVAAVVMAVPTADAVARDDVPVVVVGDAADGGGGRLDVLASGEAPDTLFDDGVLSADAGAPGEVFAVRRHGPRGGSLVRVTTREGEPETVAPATRDLFHVAVAASATGDVAALRYRARPLTVPKFLQPVVERLRDTDVRPLVPPAMPPGVEHVVAEAERRRFHLLFTNDPTGTLPHAEQENWFVTGIQASEPLPSDATPVTVRGRPGGFFCGASACFLTWRERRATYTVGEFGGQQEAVAFAEGLATPEELLGPFWRIGEGYSSPELVVHRRGGGERVLEGVESFCECSFQPVDWSPDGRRLLVVAGADGSTELREYDAERGTHRPAWDGPDVVDAAYGPDGVLALVASESGPPEVRGRAETLASDAISMDAAGHTLAYVRRSGDVVTRDLRSGDERVVAAGAGAVSLGAAARATSPPAAAPRAPASGGDRPIAAIAGAAVAIALIAGGALVATRRRR